jgi:uncharacterized membrane protein
MKTFAIALALVSIVASQAAARTVTRDEYRAKMSTGQCWGICAYKTTMQECMSCGLALDGPDHKAGEVYYCHKLQPKCGRK